MLRYFCSVRGASLYSVLRFSHCQASSEAMGDGLGLERHVATGRHERDAFPVPFGVPSILRMIPQGGSNHVSRFFSSHGSIR